MLTALVFGVLGSSALVVGGALGAYWDAPRRLTGVFLAFASGTLISALAFELFPEAVELGGILAAAGGLVAGATVFVVVNTWLDAATLERSGTPEELPGADALDEDVTDELAPATADQREKVEELAERSDPHGAGPGVGAGVGLALLAAVTLDGVPENLALGVSLVGGEGAAGGVALLVAIVASNLPEALVGGIAMRRGGRGPVFVIGIWSLAAAALTVAVVLGYGLLSGADPLVLALALSFAGGAVLASLADTLMPEAFEHGKPLNAFATAAGFLVSFVLAG
ncbi:zinc permease [Aquipuribacter nitratireducens]|uniref:ZIP family metal transporter n=1 Tax=Aquipuribacter nitratireducens TaxID=650104 RepID=A0ABW0GS10_9MICO